MTRVWGLLCAFLAMSACLSPAARPVSEPTFRDRLPQDEVIYFVLPDRFENGDPSNDTGGIPGGRLAHGFDPAARGFYHGGDLKGLVQRLDYIAGLGATAIWLGPIYQNKAVQGRPGEESAGYHGYWITDFTAPDAHFGTEDDLGALVDAAHGRGLKVYLDIITNHTADVIKFRECDDPDWPGERVAGECQYRAIADYPFTTQGRADGPPINPGFLGDKAPFQTPDNFAALGDMRFAYTPFTPPGEEAVKTPAWLNDPRLYHNRGNSVWVGESVTYGDFAGLDDLMTEHPEVVSGFIDIFKEWITKYRIDGFRIDTARHVNPEFWLAFNPAMIEHAATLGIPNFYVFGEVYDPDPAGLARFTRTGGFPAVLDFGFQSVLQDVLVNGAPAGRFATLFAADEVYAEGAPVIAPVFTGNHDMGRLAGFLRQKHPGMADAELLARVELAHAIMFFARGVPVIYYGDEQGFVSDGNDQLAREDMFGSRVAVYNDNDLIGTEKTTADSNFDTSHPLFKAIAGMAQRYADHPALRRGAQIVRLAEHDGGVLAVSRRDASGGEYLVAFNTRAEPRKLNLAVDARSATFESVLGNCPDRAIVTGVVEVTLEALSFAICRSNNWKG